MIPSRLSNLAAARRRFGERADRFVPFFSVGDPLADAAVDALATLPASTQAELVAGCTAGTLGDGAPAALRALQAQLHYVPFWVDLERCSRGGTAFVRSGALGGIALGFGSLAGAYCSPGGNKPLAFTGRLIESAYRRLAETGQFVYAVSQPGALVRGAAGFEAIVKVRLLHARIRRGLERHPDWRADAWGTPINQADMAATVLLFSHAVATSVRKLGGMFSRRDEEDLVQLWRYAGYLLGVDHELLCATAHDAEQLLDLCGSIEGPPDADSKRLIEAMFDPAIFRAKLPNEQAALRVRALYLAICRLLLGDERADALGLPRSRFDVLLRRARPLVKAATSAAAVLPYVDHALVVGGRAYWQRFIRDGASASAA